MLALLLFLLWVTPLIPWISTCFTNIGKYSEGLLTAHFQSYSWNLKALCLSCPLWLYPKIFPVPVLTSALVLRSASREKKKKKEVPNLGLFLKVWLQVCLNQSLFNESFSLPSAPHHPSGLWLYLLSMTSPIPDSHLPDFVPIPSVLVLGPPVCHCSSQSST